MPKGGHNRKPTQSKILQGTFRRGRAVKNEAKPRLVNEVPKPPDSLPVAGRQLWKKLAPELIDTKLLTFADLEAFEMLCFAFGLYREMNAAIRKGGRTYSAYFKGRNSQTAPEWNALKTTFDTFKSYATEFGLTPAARGRIEIPEKEKPEADPMESLLNEK